MALLQTQQLTLYAGNKLLCEQLNWQCAPGEIWAVLGRNGAGKTTLLHSLAGIRACTAPQCRGTILLQGKSLTSWSRKQIAQQLGLLLQDYHDPFPGTVSDYALMGRHPYLHALQWESEQDYARVSDALKRVGLEDFTQRDIQSLSGGEFQRMRIAMLLVQDPQILLLDEPVNHLDLQFQHAVLEALVATVKASDKTMVMTIHDVNLALRYCTHALLIHDNGRVESGEIGHVITEQSLTQLYQYPVKAISTAGRSLFVAD
jgi:iron complex transport system ATP-binding protein